MFGVILFFLFRFVFFESHYVISNPFNRRIHLIDSNIVRGDIFDRNGTVLATTVSRNGINEREYPFPTQFSHLIGYITGGRTGIESNYNFSLQNLYLEMLQRTYQIIFNTPLRGNSLVLTVDADLQLVAYEQLAGRNGAIVAIEPSTGQILSMVSFPDFNLNTLQNDWAQVSTDTINSPLLNRATQGLYPPGSIYKIITALAAIDSGMGDFTFVCTGEAVFNDSSIRCFNNIAHGYLDMESAFAHSCNTYFAALALELGYDRLIQSSEEFLFNSVLSYSLEYNIPRFNLTEFSEESELIQTSIGQGRTLTTALHMAMITSGIANNGIIMTPYVVQHELTFNGNIRNRELPGMLTRATTSENAEIMTSMMIEVVERGTGTTARINGVQIAAKTGTAEVGNAESHGWFVAFAPAKNPEIAVAVVLENAGGSVPAQIIAREIIQHALG